MNRTKDYNAQGEAYLLRSFDIGGVAENLDPNSHFSHLMLFFSGMTTNLRIDAMIRLLSLPNRRQPEYLNAILKR